MREEFDEWMDWIFKVAPMQDIAIKHEQEEIWSGTIYHLPIGLLCEYARDWMPKHMTVKENTLVIHCERREV